jgi:5-hydroxyisourate hydrolase
MVEFAELSADSRVMSPITTHILDTARGRPAAGIAVTLEFESGGRWTKAGSGATDAEGRIRDLLPGDAKLNPGKYRLTFATAAYSGFYPSIEVSFVIEDPSQHYHIPLLLSPFGYSTYRGS